MSRDLADLIRYTLIWLFVAAWLGFGFTYQTSAGGPYTDLSRRGFEVFVAIIVPGVAALIAVAWVVTLRERRP